MATLQLNLLIKFFLKMQSNLESELRTFRCICCIVHLLIVARVGLRKGKSICAQRRPLSAF